MRALRPQSAASTGGRTAFPELRLSFEPEVGAAVVWYNIDREGALDGRATSSGDADLSRGSGMGRRPRDGLTAAAHPRGAASERL